jgi:hypothetical protein
MIRAVAIRVLRQVLLVILLDLMDGRRGNYFRNGNGRQAISRTDRSQPHKRMEHGRSWALAATLRPTSRGELLCQAFEVYRESVTDPRISFEHLVCAPAAGEELTFANCEPCGALTVVDRMSFEAHHCQHCASQPTQRPPSRHPGR